MFSTRHIHLVRKKAVTKTVKPRKHSQFTTWYHLKFPTYIPSFLLPQLESDFSSTPRPNSDEKTLSIEISL